MKIRNFVTGAVLSLALASPAFADALVDADWLQKNLDNPKVRVFEVSVDPGTYERGHIPGATNIRWHTDLVDPVRRDIASKENLQKILQESGVDKDTTVVLYGDNNNWFAAWGAWVFDVYGVDVKLLDGGRKYWEAKNLPVDSKLPSYTKTSFELKEADTSIRARFSDVLKVAESEKPETQLIDIRSPKEYSGEIVAPEGFKELAVRAGHIPGAKNFPWAKAVKEDGTFKSKDELQKAFAELGVDGSKPIITYCRIGERSSHTWFALSKILGYEVKNYDGSWTEYGNAVGVPVTNVAGTVWQGK
ncbi:sulfurtransferase [Terrihabitans sp. B22-R8]|uniref:sulfurtransferase n=1 Tax=Terrihabitans sp. B22-R8 TaxID=3425128 RepID=UPI00403D4B9A